jgi:hypothetical protein
LEAKVFNLQEELTASFRNKSEIAQSLLEYTKDLKNVKVQLKETKSKFLFLNLKIDWKSLNLKIKN